METFNGHVGDSEGRSGGWNSICAQRNSLARQRYTLMCGKLGGWWRSAEPVSALRHEEAIEAINGEEGVYHCLPYRMANGLS